MKHTIGFEAKQAWEASVAEVRSDPWITISPTSGQAGKSTISVTLTQNPSEQPRKGTVTIVCGSKPVSISITQQGVYGPNHPLADSKNRLTYIEIASTTAYGFITETYRGYNMLIYNDQGILTNFNNFSFHSEQTDKLNGSKKTAIERSAGKLSLTTETFETRTLDLENLPGIILSARKSDYQLNTDGLISQHTAPNGLLDIVATYNTDGTLKSRTYPFHPMNDQESTYTWKDGDLTNVTTTGLYGDCTGTYTYTEHLTPWHGIDIGAILICGNDDLTGLLGIAGLRTKHLPSEWHDSKGNSSRYEYTFDTEGRVSTIVINSILEESIEDHTEYKLHYGRRSVLQPDYIPCMLKQEVVEEGTLYNDKQNPDANYAVPHSYTSYAKIHTTVSDGTSRNKVEYREVTYQIDLEENLPDIVLTQEEVDNFKLVSTSLHEDAPGSLSNPHQFSFTMEYNCFSIEMFGKVNHPICEIYSSKTGHMGKHRMPMLPFDKNSFICDPPEMKYMGADETRHTFNFTQKYLLQVNPDATDTEPYIKQINRSVYVNR